MSAPSELKEVLDQQHEYAGKDKDLYSLSSAGASVDGKRPIYQSSLFTYPLQVPNGIDTEVAQFFADTTNNKPVEIDDATNRRLRWLIHRRVLVVMVVTYFAQTLDKGYVALYYCARTQWLTCGLQNTQFRFYYGDC